MELTPKLLTDDVDFRVALRGYDKDEVDDFLERVAVAVGQLQEQLSSAVDRARKAEARAQQALASPAKAEAPAEVAAPVAAPAEPAGVEATGADADELNEELRRTLVLAQRTADAAIREAREEADRITAEAEEHKQHTLQTATAESQRVSDEAKGRLLAELTELERVRDSLKSDITVLDRHLGDHRAKVRETVQVLRRLVDDPQSFTVQPAPTLGSDSAPADSGSTAAPEAETASAPAAAEPEPVTEAEPEAIATPAEPAEPEALATPAEPVGSSEPDDFGSGPGGSTGAQPAVESEASAPVAQPWPTSAPLPSRERTPAHGTPAVHDPAPSPSAPAPAPRASVATAGPHGGAATAVVGTERRTTAPIAGSPRPPAAAPRAAADAGLDLRLDADRPDVAIGGAARAAESTGHRLGGLFAEDAPSWRQSDGSRSSQGPHTQPVAVTRIEEEPDDAFLAELRRAMTDEEPLGPRDGVESVPFATPEAPPRTRFRRSR